MYSTVDWKRRILCRFALNVMQPLSAKEDVIICHCNTSHVISDDINLRLHQMPAVAAAVYEETLRQKIREFLRSAVPYWCLVGNGRDWGNGMTITSDDWDHSLIPC